MADDGRPAVGPLHVAVGQRAGYAGDEHEKLCCIAEPVMTQTERQPAADIARNVVEKDEPQREASAHIKPEVAVGLLQAEHRLLWQSCCWDNLVPSGLQAFAMCKIPSPTVQIVI